MKSYMMLIRREFWEHRGLWIAPLIAAGVILVGTLLGDVSDSGFMIVIDDAKLEFARKITDVQRASMFGALIVLLSIPIMLTTLVVVFFYLADCLYSERKDRSILFWKSLPVSDSATVGSKLATGLLAAPLIAWGLALVTTTLCFLIWKVRVSATGLSNFMVWDTVMWLKVQALGLVNAPIAALWYAPIAGYIVAVSAWARRSVSLWLVLPPVLIVWFEDAVLNSGRIAKFLENRLTGFFEYVGGKDPGVLRPGAESGIGRVEQLTARLEQFGAVELLATPQLWLGVVAAALLFYVAVRLRRYRDDT
jgi:ABC-2 type transport system permease protein